jgi:hypothetical protein
MRVGEMSYFAEESIYGLGQDAGAFSGRVEVKDAASGSFIKDASVTLLNGDKDPNAAMTVGVFNTDAGGNAAFMNVAPEGGTGGPNYWYKVEASGYAPQVVPATPNVVKSILLAKSGGRGAGVPVAAAVGAVAILGILGYAFFKK